MNTLQRTMFLKDHISAKQRVQQSMPPERKQPRPVLVLLDSLKPALPEAA